ncbi:GNAT family N-acetyltransferase [Streptomyces sp. NPDC001941]|uniref:GNAT family N-acetyltransferase n=1 Tax=Streptomyces sp. NPDC001941 TaxID=3154659 RepID=UPI00331C4206
MITVTKGEEGEAGEVAEAAESLMVEGAEPVTPRLRLRRLTEDDLDAVHAIHADPRTNRHNPAGPVTDVAQSARMLGDWIAHWDRYGFGYWAVVPREADGGPAGRVVGFSGLMRREADGRPVLNLYYRFHPDAWGSGYATEAARAARDLARDRFPGEDLVALVRDTNLPSARVAERLGLVADAWTIQHGGVTTRVYREPLTATVPGR